MAKKDTVAVKEGNQYEALEALLKKKYKVDVMLPAEGVSGERDIIIPVSPRLDVLLNGGMQSGSWMNVIGKPKKGKALKNGSLVYCPDGPKKIEDMKVGDKVISPMGGISTVVGVYPQGIKELYRITFSDNTYIDCCKEHLWEVYDRPNFKIKTTEEIYNYMQSRKTSRTKYFIKLTSPTNFDINTELPINPYILGCLIGDGGLSQGSIKFTTASEFILEKMKLLLPEFDIDKITGAKYDYIIKDKLHNQSNKTNRLIDSLRNLKIMGLTSHDKFIPEIYKLTSLKNRLELIKGLMDTDGEVTNDKYPRAIYTTVSLQLANDFKWLIESIGGICNINERYTSCNGKKFKSYRCSIRIQDITILYSLPEKSNKAKINKKIPRRGIVSIERIDNDYATCIKLDSNDGLFLTDNFIVTHNTTTVLRMAKCAQDMGYFIIYNNVEHRLKDMNLKGCTGLDLSPNKFRRIQSTKEKILTNQDFLNMNEDILRNTEKVMCIFDSISALASGKQMEEGAGTSSRGGMSNSVVVSQFCSNMAPVVLMNKHIVVNIQQTMANVSGYGPANLAKGGEAIKFQADTILWIKSAKEVLSGGKIIGQTVEWEAECSALGTIPGTKVESMIRYGEGIDIYWELIEMAKEFGIIAVSGAWLSYGEHKIQGVENFNVLLRENPELFDEIAKKVKEVYEI